MAAIVLLLVIVVLVVDGSSKDTIADGVRIGTLDVGGLDRGAARTLVQRRLANSTGERVVATFGERRFVLRPQIASARIDADASVDAALRRSRRGNPFSRVFGANDASGSVAPQIAYSRGDVQAWVGRVAKRIDRPARDADIDWHDGKLVRTRARNGLDVRRPQFMAALVRAMGSTTRTVKVPVRVTERPNRTFADFAKRYPTVLAVDRDAKVLRLYKNLKLAEHYRIAVGRAGLETAAGRYKIVEKIVDPPWHVPNSSWAGALAGRTIPPGDPQNPLEARWMGFHDGQGIHGTTDVNSLGTAASHGCIRMAVRDVKRLYREVKIGTPLFLQ
ncbi:MAG: L,D-transpeptidase ErfK/SrfK [Solirubrobacteraceae bacterium]|nr:L,D-transpeptidase ErfK/SrfK [Solirubrobacteraceae bacterium]